MRSNKARRTPAGALAAIASLACFAAAPPALSSDWVVGSKSQARLLDGGAKEGVRLAGAQIRLDGAAVTYWRTPGDAGAPPIWSFDGSANLGKAVPLYPQPLRIDEAGAQVFGYRGEIIFPIEVTPRDAAQPVHLQVSLDYAVCETLCLPVHAQMQIDLPPGGASIAGPEAELVAGSLREVPRRLDATQAAARLEISALDSAQKQWRLRWLPPAAAGAARDLFVETPQGFYIETKAEGENLFLLTLVEHPANKAAPDAPLRLTLTGQRPVEFDLILP